MTPDAVVRVATPADAAVLVELRAVMFEGMGTPAGRDRRPGLAAGRPRLVHRHAWPTRGRGSWSPRSRGTVVSCAVGEVTALIPGPNTVTGSVGLISNVATVAGHRGRGLAAACTDDLLRWFVEQTDVRRVDLFATEAGARIYTRRGFTVRGFEAMVLPVPR